MNPHTVFSASMITSLVLWFPSMQACLRGDLDLAAAGLRYLAALTVSRLALGFLARLLDAYRAAQQPASPAQGLPSGDVSPDAAPVVPDARPHRRRSDLPGEAGPDPASMAA
jgi:hypothetical protein